MSDVKNTHRPFKIIIKRLDGIDQLTFILIELWATHFPININFIHQESKEILKATLVGVSKRTEVPVFQEYLEELKT